MEFFDWNMLESFAGAALAVSVLTQLTKSAPLIRRMPTQLWSYLLALGTLVLAQVFGEGFETGGAVLSLFNAALVSLVANGGYAMLLRMKEGLKLQAAQ